MLNNNNMGNFNMQSPNIPNPNPNQNPNIPNPNIQSGMYMQQNMQNFPPASNNQPKSKKPLIIAGVTIGAVILVGLFSVFVPVFGQQTLAARSMDAMGFHGIAMKLDAITQQDKTMAALASINPKRPETCGDMWQYMDNFSPSKLEAMQFKNYVSIVPMNEKYAEDIFFNTYLEARMSMVDERASALMEINGRLNGDKINSMLEEIEPGSSSPELAGNFEISAIGEAYVDTTGGAFKLSKLNVEGGKNLNTKDSLNSWYKGNFNLTRLQKEGVSELLGVLMDLSEAKSTDMLEDSTGKIILTNSCKMIDKIEVKGPQNVEIGKDRQKFNVRPVVYTLNQDSAKIQQEIMPEVVKAIVNDQKLPSFIKSKHPEVVRISEALEKIDRSLALGEITKEEFDQAVDSLFEDLRKEFTDEYLKDVFSVSSNDVLVDTGFEVITQPTEVFVDIKTGFVIGTRNAYIIKPTNQILKEIPNGEFKDFIREGFKVTQEIYDVAYNQDVPTIEVISGNIRPIDQMPEDFMRTNLYIELEDIFAAFEPQPEPQLIEDDIFLDEFMKELEAIE